MPSRKFVWDPEHWRFRAEEARMVADQVTHEQARTISQHPDRSYLSVKLGDKPEPNYSRHWCFKAPSRAAVDAFWKAGIANGGTDDGPPGVRTIYHPTYYAAFLIDPSGNRVEAVCHLGSAP
jgi:hypothetical protein